MKKLFKLISLLRAIAELRGHADRGRRGYMRPRHYYPLYGHHRSPVERVLRRFLSRQGC